MYGNFLYNNIYQKNDSTTVCSLTRSASLLLISLTLLFRRTLNIYQNLLNMYPIDNNNKHTKSDVVVGGGGGVAVAVAVAVNNMTITIIVAEKSFLLYVKPVKVCM